MFGTLQKRQEMFACKYSATTFNICQNCNVGNLTYFKLNKLENLIKKTQFYEKHKIQPYSQVVSPNSLIEVNRFV